MSNKKFIAIIVTALVLFVLAIIPMAIATAESTNNTVAIVIGFRPSVEGLAVVIVDENGNILSYYPEQYGIYLGDIVEITLHDYEVVDAIEKDISILEIIF